MASMRGLDEFMKQGVFDLELSSFFRLKSVVLSLGGWGVWFFSSFQCDSYEIYSGKHLGVCISVANNRLFVGSIPRTRLKKTFWKNSVKSQVK